MLELQQTLHSLDKFCHICKMLEDELGCYAVQANKGDQNAVEKIYRCTEVARALVCQKSGGADAEDCMQEPICAFKNMKSSKVSL